MRVAARIGPQPGISGSTILGSGDVVRIEIDGIGAIENRFV